MTSLNSSTGRNNATAGINSTHPFQTRSNRPTTTEEGDEVAKELQFHIDRANYFKNVQDGGEYEPMTGFRIAATLGGFFLLVLITLLYKSKCKKSSREGTPTPRMEANDHDLALLAAAMLPMQEAQKFHRFNRSPIECELFEDEPGCQSHFLPSPQVFLTQPNDSSQSSNESELSLSSYRGRESSVSSGGLAPPIPGPSHPRPKVRKKRKVASSQMSWLKQNIDIHVIQPTPTISPSGSTNFHPQPLFRKQPRDLTMHRGSDSDAAFTITPGEFSSASGSICNPLFFLNAENSNIRYMDDTSSENIPTRASDFEDDEVGDVQSLGSDSVFLFHSRQGEEVDDGETDQCQVTLTQAHAQVHHRDSYCSSEFESVNDYLESHRRRSSSTQTTFSDLRQCVSFGLPVGNPAIKSEPLALTTANLTSLNGNTPPRESTLSNKGENYTVVHITTNSSFSPHAPIIPTSTSPTTATLSVSNAATPHHPLTTTARKRSFESREKLLTFSQIQGGHVSKSE